MAEKKITEYRVYIPTAEEEYLLSEKKCKAKSILIIFLPYLTEKHDPAGNLSLYTQGGDYHLWGKKTLDEMMQRLQEIYPADDFQVQVDIGRVNEKEIAYRSGLGMRGMNSLIINEKYGSYGFLGLILTTALLEAYMTEPKDCMKCMKCVGACPGKAIKGDFSIAVSRCASEISQKKEELTPDEKKILQRAGKVFGCDICQQCCPHNQGIELRHMDETIMKDIQEQEVLSLSNKQFKKKYDDRSFSWRGKKIIQRNLDILRKGKDE